MVGDICAKFGRLFTIWTIQPLSTLLIRVFPNQNAIGLRSVKMVYRYQTLMLAHDYCEKMF